MPKPSREETKSMRPPIHATRADVEALAAGLREAVPRRALLFGVGPAELKGDTRRYLAYRVENGVTTVLTPRRHDSDWGESLASAVARVSEAQSEEFPRYARTK